MVTVAHRSYTLAEYVQLEAYANVRHEFVDGQIYAMAGGSPEHGTFAANVIASLAVQLEPKRCRVQTSDVRIRVVATGLSTYPDVSIVCGHAEMNAADPQAITNPTVLVEVLSPSTQAYDQGEKLEHYKKIDSLREVVFVAHDARRIEVLRRNDDGSWPGAAVSSTDRIELDSIDCTLDVETVFRDPLA